MSDNNQLSTSGGYYNSVQLYDELHSGERPAETGQDTYDDLLSDEPSYYTDVNPDQERIYQEIKNENHYQPLDLNRQAIYETLGQQESGAHNVNFRKISVRKTIWDL